MEIDIQQYLNQEIGSVQNVDTKKVSVSVEKEEILNRLKINDIVVLSGNNADEKLIGIVTRVSKKKVEIDEDDEENDEQEYSYNFCNVTLVGTFYKKLFINKENIFKRAVNTYPEINSKVYLADGEALSIIMNSLETDISSEKRLNIGKYASNKTVQAILDGNKFFQRHAIIVGSTGSGKSFTVANILEKANELNYANIIVFDLHGEYNELSYAKQIKICDSDKGLHIPLWFFNYEEIHSLFIESFEGTSTNQRAAVVRYILQHKKEYIDRNMKGFNPEIITADTPVPFSAMGLKEYLENENIKEEATGEVYKTGEKKGQEKTKQGQYYGKLTNLITRIQTKIDDKKYGFVFNESKTMKSNYLNEFMNEIMGTDNKIKVIDLSEIPSDMLSIIIGVVTRLVYDVQFWMSPGRNETRHPLTFICDEAHLYMPLDTSKLKSVENKSLEIFEKISKEGRKYGVYLVVVSQRPAELNSTIISQCNNIISLKIINDRDKSAVATMLTDSLVGLVETLPNLDVGECIIIIIGDSIKLPTKIILDKPKEEPKSSTIDFWDRWIDGKGTVFDIDSAIQCMIKQAR